MAEQLVRTRAKRGGNRGVMTKLMNEAEGLINADEIDEQRLKIIADSLNEKLTLVKSLDEEIIESCHVEEIANEIEESEDINLRVLFLLQSIMKATSPKSNDKVISTVKGTNGDETAPCTSLRSTTGLQTTNGSENVDSGNTQVVQNVESSTSDVSQPLHMLHTPPAASNATAEAEVPHSSESSGTNIQLSSNSNISTVTSPNYVVLCSEKLDWDQPLRGEMNKTWNLIFEELKPLGYVRIPRCYFYPGFSKIDVQLHGFSDASERAYAAVVYIRVVYSDGRIETRLAASKTRVSPIKKQTIPRLELLGAVILSRLTATVLKALPEQVNRSNYWVDSRTVLCWIQNDKHWKQYVKHRVDEIRQMTAKKDWRYCPGVQNPADLPSRGLTGNEMVDNSMWWCGPQFLQLPEEEWPRDQPTADTNEAALSEVVKNPPNVVHVLASCEEITTEVNLAEIINCQQISSLDRLFRVTAYVLRYVDILKRRTSTRKSRMKEESTKEDERELNSAEIIRAESLWIKTVQASSFKDELKFVQNQCQTKPRRVEQFGLFLDENKLLRCRGWLNNATLSSDNKNPILLPSKHPYVELIIRQTHDKVKHSSVNNTLTTIRERFWILRGRQAVKRVLKRCVTCRRLEGLPYSSYNVPDLPSVCVSEDPPFTHTGVDFAGPLFVCGNSTTESDNNKCYVCLFTCASTRAVHLELTPNLTVESFLLAFRRFTSRRGLPATLMSDNGKTFRGSSKEIVKIARSKEVFRYLAINGVSWRFIVEKAPWWGGFWERLIQSVKRCMKKSLGRTTLSYDELNTLLVEIESVVNSRPLTYVEDDQDGVSYTLSPSHLINGRRVTNTPNDSHFEVISTNESLTRRARHHRHLLRQFTDQWRKIYLLSLRERHAQVTKNRKGVDIAIGDVVILKNDTSNRMFWKLAKVEELLPGKDGNIRAAIIKVSNADRNPRLLKRSVKHLFPLEVNNNDDIDRTEESEAEPTCVPPVCDTPNTSANTRPRRNAAMMGRTFAKISYLRQILY